MTQTINLPQEIGQLKEEADQFMLTRLTVLPKRMYELVAPAMSRGKRIRGLLVLLTGLNAGASKTKLIPVAAACELLHYATLVHDDIIDLHQERRGNPAVHTSTSTGAAVLAADSMFSISLSMVLETEQYEIIHAFVRTLEEITTTELTVLLQESKPAFSQEEYLAWITAKTASLCKTSAFSGGVIGGADTYLSHFYSRIGELFGIAFQIRDDILDYCENTLQGRVPGCDLRSGLITLPLICYYHTCGITSELQDWMDGNREDVCIEMLLKGVKKSGALDMSQKEAEKYAEMAAAMVRALPSERMKEPLINLCRYAVSRKH